MANLESTQLKDGFQTLVSIGTTTVGGHPSNPATGSLTNGKGTALTQVTLGLGSSSAPSYSFTGDVDTGMFSSGANVLNLATGGNNRMTIASGGNISIGTANSSAKLQVGTSSEEILRLERDTTTNDSFIDLTYASGHSNDSDANHEYSKIRTKVVANLSGSESSELHFQTINSGTMGTPIVIDNLGLVGIGSTSGGVPNPAYALEVQANSTSGVLAVQNAANDRNTFRSSNSGGTRTLDIGNNSSGHGIVNIRNSSGTVKIQLLGSGDSYFNGGNVGIGTDSPANKLHVYHNATQGDPSSHTPSNATLQIQDSSNSLYLDGNSIIGTGAGALHIGNASNTALNLWTNGTNRIQIEADGKVGIGTTSPSNLLHVVGSGSTPFATQRDVNSGGFAMIQGKMGDSASTSAGHVYSALVAGIEDNTNGAEDGYFAIEVSEGGSASEKLRVTSSGDVGIGTSSPDRQLQVHEGTSGTSTMKFTNSTTGEDGDTGFFVGINGSEQPILYGYNSTDMVIGTSGTERMRILSGGGITFNGDTATANALDDYEEGTHTTSLSDGTYTAALGDNELAYTKIGNMVTITGQFFVASYDSSASASRISLPFTIANLTDSAGNFAGTVRAKQLNTSNTHNVVAFGDEGNSYVLLQETVDNGSPVNIGGGAYSSGTEITLNFSYFTS